MTLSLIEAYELVCHAEAVEEKLIRALDALESSSESGLERERGWLATALELVSAARKPAHGLPRRAVRLAELADAREEHARELQDAWVDSLEKLVAGITFHENSRAPIIEALFSKWKFPVLRRAPRAVVAQHAAELERRLNTSYAKRIFGEPSFAFAQPVIEQSRLAYAQWNAMLSDDPIEPSEAESLRAELLGAAAGLERPLTQARLLAEAALTPLEGQFDALGLGSKPRRRLARAGLAAMESSEPGADDELDEATDAAESGLDEAESAADERSDSSGVDALEAAPVEPSETSPAKPASRRRRTPGSAGPQVS